MTTPSARLLRFLGGVDIVSGIALFAGTGWFGDQLDASTTVVSAAAASLSAFGLGSLLLAPKPSMRAARVAFESAHALVAICFALLRDPTTLGVAVLFGSAAWSTAAAVIVRRPATPWPLGTASHRGNAVS